MKICNNSYRATSRRQLKTSGLQGTGLSSLKRGRREDGDITKEKTENFWTGACAWGREGVLEQEKCPCTGSSLSGRSKGELWSLRKPGQSRDFSSVHAEQGLRRQKTEKPVLLSQWLLSPWTTRGLWPQPDCGLREPREAQRNPAAERASLGTNPASAHKPCGTKVRPGCPERGDGQTSGGALVTRLSVVKLWIHNKKQNNLKRR